MRQSVAAAAAAFQVGCIRKVVCEWDALLRKHCLLFILFFPSSVCFFVCTVVGLKAILRNMPIIWIHSTSESSACLVCKHPSCLVFCFHRQRNQAPHCHTLCPHFCCASLTMVLLQLSVFPYVLICKVLYIT